LTNPYVTVTEDTVYLEGTKVPVRRLYAWFRRGVSVETLFKRYPHVRPAVVLGSLAYAIDNIDRIETELARERAIVQPVSRECCPRCVRTPFNARGDNAYCTEDCGTLRAPVGAAK